MSVVQFPTSAIVREVPAPTPKSKPTPKPKPKPKAARPPKVDPAPPTEGELPDVTTLAADGRDPKVDPIAGDRIVAEHLFAKTEQGTWEFRRNAGPLSSGRRVVEVISVHSPSEDHPTLVFLTQRWVLPSGKWIGQPVLRFIALPGWRRMWRGKFASVEQVPMHDAMVVGS